ncbi:MAG TPA: hypothetical protein VK021_02055 [Flavobacteriaceae bacterium]|nr:hypothetical protein [Flavobacteriaceae bacterium]
MIEYGSNYDEVLKWFIDNKEMHSNITNSGVTKHNKNWFVWRQGSFSYKRYR